MSGEIKYGMVGGHLQAFIGEVHRKALLFDTRVKLAAGCFSTNAARNKETAESYGLSDNRTYSNYAEMAEKEGKRDDGIDFAVIVTPNSEHFKQAKEFLQNGINVVCEKPLCFEIAEAEELARLAEEKGLLFGVTYTYTGYTMPKVMKEMIANGKIGRISAVNAEYIQDWLIDELSEDGGSSSVWRTDPQYSGIANCIGDIGTHMENMVHYLTGLEIKRVAATANSFGKRLDLNANMLVEYTNGVNGAYWCSQIAAGRLNGLAVRIYGDKGALEWEQHYPDYVKYTPKGCATQVLSRGREYLTEDASKCSRLPAGHPEGVYVAFANIYRNYVNALIKSRKGEKPDEDFPTVYDGLNGIKFVHAVVESVKRDSEWVNV